MIKNTTLIFIQTEYQSTKISRCGFIYAYAKFDFSKMPFKSKKIVLDFLYNAAGATIVINGDTVKNFTSPSNTELKPGVFITYTNGKGIFEGDIETLLLGGFEVWITECVFQNLLLLI